MSFDREMPQTNRQIALHIPVIRNTLIAVTVTETIRLLTWTFTILRHNDV